MISSNLLQSYLLKKFEGKYKIGSGGEEMVISSVFEDDRGRMKMSVNLYTGLWQDFQSHTSGNFTQLYAFLEGMNIGKAYDKLTFDSYFFDEEPPKIKNFQEKEVNEELEGLEEVNASSFEKQSELATRAWDYLYTRRLFDLHEDTLTYYVCHEGRFADRLIIPIFVEDKMVYWQGRSLSLNHKPKYLTPISARGHTILAPFDYDAKEVYVTEGPFDWITLKLAGLNATCTFGSNVSDIQAQSLRIFPGKVVMAYDNDEAGYKGIARFEKTRKRFRMPEFYITTPPQGKNDWNEAWCDGVFLGNLSTLKYDYALRLREEINSLY